MKKVLLLGLALALCLVVVGLGFGLFQFVERLGPGRVAGPTSRTLLVYQIDRIIDADATSGQIVDAIRQRLDPYGTLQVAVKRVDPDLIEIRIPRRQPDHDALVEQLKTLLSMTGDLQFRILANDRDDRDAVEVGLAEFDEAAKLSAEQRLIRTAVHDRLAKAGLSPPGPEYKGNRSFQWSTGHDNGRATYSWIALSKFCMQDEGLSNEPELLNRPGGSDVVKARTQGRPVVFGPGRLLLFSRPCINQSLSDKQRQDAPFEYFFLARDPEPAKQISGKHVLRVARAVDDQLRPAINFTFDKIGGDLNYELTSANRPSGPEGMEMRRLAIILNGQVITAPTLNATIRTEAQISLPLVSHEELDHMVRLLASGTLPVTLKAILVKEEEPPTNE